MCGGLVIRCRCRGVWWLSDKVQVLGGEVA